HRGRGGVEEKPPPVPIVLGPQFERAVVRARRCGEGIERGSAVTGVPQSQSRRADELFRDATPSTSDFECAQVVMSAQLRVVLRAPERLDPLGGALMLLRPVDSRDL